MKIITHFFQFCIVFLAYSGSALAQYANEVSNPSFEDRTPSDFCPDDYGQLIQRANSWEASPSWAGSTYRSTDYYHTCGSGMWDPSENGTSTHSGSAYVGFIAVRPGSNDSEEYLYQELSEPLMSGHTYYIEFYAHLQKYSRYSVKKLGLYITNSTGQIDSKSDLSNITPQIPNSFPATGYYNNPNSWVKISGTFTPGTSDMKHLVIGNFDSGFINNQPDYTTNSFGCTTTQCCNNNNSQELCYQTAYYFIDDVTIWDLDDCTGSLNSGQISVSGPSAVCPGNVYYYNAGVSPMGLYSEFSYSWSYPSNWTVPSGVTNSSQIGLQVPTYNPDYGTVRVSVNNGCGASPYNGITVFPAFGCGSFFVYFPNPADNKITLIAKSKGTLKSDHGEEMELKNYTIELYNDKGERVASLKTDLNEVDIPTEKLPEGSYTMKIHHNKETIQHSIIVEH